MRELSKREIASACGMPYPPDPTSTVGSLGVRSNRTKPCAVPSVSGIYFAWRSGTCFYVGKSTNLRGRLATHGTVVDGDELSWLEMDESKIHLAELFYIWLLAPTGNRESRSTRRRDALPVPYQLQPNKFKAYREQCEREGKS